MRRMLRHMEPDPVTNKYKKEIIRAYEQEWSLRMTILRENKSLYVFNKHVLDAEKGDDAFVKLAPFHKALCNFVQDRKDKKKLVLIPRSHLKSKLITIGYSLFSICQNPKIRILLYSATWQMAVDLHLSIQKALEGNAVIHELYGNLAKDAKEWSQDRTRLVGNDKREPTITAAGIENNLVGGHYDLIIMDDVVNRDNIGTQDQIQKVVNRYRDSLDLLEPNGQLIVIGTRWHDSDLYGWILDPSNNIKSSFDIMIKQAYEGSIVTGEGFYPLWEGKFTLEELQKRLREEGWSHFSAQYMNDPVPEEDATFKRSWFQYIEDITELKGKLLNKFLTIDPAISLQKDADYTAMVVSAQDENGYIYILDIVRSRLSPSDIINEIFRLRDKWDLVDIGIEDVAFQKALAYSLREDERFKRHPFHITELKPNERAKDQRIKGLQPLYENGKIIHNRLLANNIYLEDELVRFPRGTHDDIIDALSYVLDIIYPARQKVSKGSRQHWLY